MQRKEERKEERRIRKSEDRDNRKNNHKRGEIYGCHHKQSNIHPHIKDFKMNNVIWVNYDYI